MSEGLRMTNKGYDGKVIGRGDLPGLRRQFQGKTLVLATGCFDLVHRGHVFFLQEAAKHGDVLVVGVNSDSSVRDIKGVGRPIVNANDRCAVLSAFGCVDFVFEYSEKCAGISIEALRPHVFCVGEDSVGKYPDELEAAERHRVRITQIAKLPAPSTTAIVSRIEIGKEQRVRPLISVIYVNWNTQKLLENSLSSLKAHSGLQQLEIIVVDNGSTDNSVAWLKDFHPDILLISLERNMGFSIGNNEGAARASGDYLLLLNTDTVVLPTTVPGLVRVLEADPTIGCVGAKHLNEDNSLQRSMDSFPNLVADSFTYTEVHRFPRVARWLGRRHAWWSAHDRLRSVDWVNGACMLFRRDAFDHAGGFDEDIFIYGEEVDLCKRISDQGWGVIFSPGAEIIHLGGGAMNRVAAKRLVLNYRGLVRFYDKHKSAGARVSIRIVLLSTICLRAGFLLLFCLFPTKPAFARRARGIITQMGPDAPMGEALGAWARIVGLLARPRV